MGHRIELCGDTTTNGLGRAVLPLQLGMLALDRLELVHQRVVVGIGDHRRVSLVVRVAELEDPLGEFLRSSTSCDQVGRGFIFGSVSHRLSLRLTADVHAETVEGTALTVRSTVHCPSTLVPA